MTGLQNSMASRTKDTGFRPFNERAFTGMACLGPHPHTIICIQDRIRCANSFRKIEKTGSGRSRKAVRPVRSTGLRERHDLRSADSPAAAVEFLFGQVAPLRVGFPEFLERVVVGDIFFVELEAGPPGVLGQ
jgi:hypothetical protein